MPWVEGDVDIDEFDTEDLVDELLVRLKFPGSILALSDKQKEELREAATKILQAFSYEELGINIKSLDDKMKLEHFAKVFEKYSAADIESRLPE